MMQDTAARQRRFGGAFVAAILGVLGIGASFSMSALSGTKTGAALALGCIFGPAMVYLAIIAPLAFPFTFYAALVPFDNILNISAFGTLTKALGILSGFAILFYLVRTRRALAPTPTLMLWLAFVLWAGVTAFWAVDQGAVFFLIPTALQLVLLYAIVSMTPVSRISAAWVTIAVVAGGVFAGAYGTYLFRSGIDVSKNGRLWIDTGTSQIDPNHFAASLLLPIAIATGIALYARTRWIAIAAVIALFVCLEGVLVSASRGAMFGIVVILAYFAVRSERRVRLVWVLVVPAAIAVLGQLPHLMTRLSDAFTTGGAGRMDIWRVGWVALKQHWLLGAGYNNFAFAYDQAFIKAHQTSYTNWHRAPHDILLQAIVELGVVGLGLLLWAWFSQFAALRDVPPSSEGYPFRLAAEATLAGMFVAALFLDIMVMKYLWLLFIYVAIVRNAYLLKPEADHA